MSQYTRTSWSEKDGLPANHIGALAQDAQGYLWLGTTAGLARFDGVRFVNWTKEYGLPPTEVTALRVTRDGSLWIGMGGAGGVLRVRGAQIERFGVEDGLPAGRVVALLQDQPGAVWVATRAGLFRFTGTRWESLVSKGISGLTILGQMYEDRTGQLWVGTSGGVLSKSPDADTFVLRSAPSQRVLSFIEDANGALWVTDPEHGVRLLTDQHPGQAIAPELVNTVGIRLSRDDTGNMWIGTVGSGVFRVRVDRGTQGATIERFTVQTGLAGDLVWSLLRDREGNVWVGTDTGLSRISRNEVLSITSTDRRVDVVRSVTVGNDGSVWAGTANGLVRFTGDRQRWYGTQDGLPSVGITAVHAAADGSIWVATQEGLARYADGRIERISSPRIQTNWIAGIATDTQGTVWLNDSDDELFRWRDGVLTHVNLLPQVGHGMVVSIYADREGRAWIGFADGGVAAYQDGKLQLYSEREGLVPGRVDSIFEDSRGGIWVGTPAGISRFNAGTFVSVTGSAQFPVSPVTSIQEDHDGFLWLGVHAGIIRFLPAEFEKAASDPSYHPSYRFINTEDGLSGTPTRRNFPAGTSRAGTQLWFVTADGLLIVDPGLPPPTPAPPIVTIEEVTGDEQTFERPPASIPHSMSRLQIAYTALSLTAPERTQFRYLLENFDTAWVDNSTSRRAVYTRLPPGRYRFRVMATDAAGAWIEARAPWEFSVEPAYYQRASFYAFLTLLGTVLLFLMWRMRVRQLRAKYELVLAERSRIAREIHDTLLQSLVAMALQLDSVSTWLDSAPELVKPALTRLRKHVERYTREARQSIWDLRSPTLEVRDLASALRESGEAIVASKDVRFEFATTGMPIPCSPRVAEHLLRVGEEAVSNAVRHADATMVRMELEFDAHQLTLRIADDGHGFDPVLLERTSPRHWGLTNMEERARQIGAHLRLVSEPGAGTTVEVTAPAGAPA